MPGWIWALPAAVIAALLIRTWIFELIRVEGASMQNTLRDGNVVLVSKLAARRGTIRRGDVIICRYPHRSRRAGFSLGSAFEISLTRHTLFVKRLIALPGDTVEIRDCRVYVNGEETNADGIDHRSTFSADYGPRRLGADQYFVLGDNRGGSRDSRAVGPIGRRMIMGRVTRMLYPFSRFLRRVR